MKRVIELRAAEGGDDAKLFAGDLAGVYVAFLTKVG